MRKPGDSSGVRTALSKLAAVISGDKEFAYNVGEYTSFLNKPSSKGEEKLCDLFS